MKKSFDELIKIINSKEIIFAHIKGVSYIQVKGNHGIYRLDFFVKRAREIGLEDMLNSELGRLPLATKILKALSNPSIDKI